MEHIYSIYKITNKLNKNSLIAQRSRIMVGINKTTRIKDTGPTEKELIGYKKTAEKLKGRELSSSHRENISKNNHSNVKWMIVYNNETFVISDSINRWAKDFGISHNVLFDALKRTNSTQNYKDKSVTITGSIKRGIYSGLQITRMPV